MWFFSEMTHGPACYQSAGSDLMLCTHSTPGTWILLMQVNFQLDLFYVALLFSIKPLLVYIFTLNLFIKQHNINSVTKVAKVNTIF